MPWVYLFLAGILEIVWAIGLKYTEGFTRLWPTVATIAVAWLSFYLLALAVRTIPVGTGYAIWTGIGAAGVAILGMLLFGEPATLARFVFLALIIVGIVGLKLAAGAH
ncbi:MAG: quaternary ammonium compound efflux SMR transporter SugE [Betaproteobacteria bacterium]|nr:quaternary ammonium compound efflux SMR transporter SugE [Betaproteobacteria bacterium]